MIIIDLILSLIIAYGIWSFIEGVRSATLDKKELPQWELLYWEDKTLKSYIFQARDYNDAVDKADEVLTARRKENPSVEYAGLFKMIK